MSTPLVSIILPTYRDAPYLSRAIESVLAQHFVDWELIVVDDGLTVSASNTIPPDARIIYIKNEENLGIQRSLNRGLAVATGTYIARIDDDDVWVDSDKLAKQVAFLQEHADYVLVGTNASIVDEQGKVVGNYHLPESDARIRNRILSKNCFLHPTIMARRDAVVLAGGYDESASTKHIEDYALWLTLGLVGKFANLRDNTTLLTIHPGSLTANNRIGQAKHMRTLVCQYKNKYPYFLIGYSLLTMRIIAVMILRVVPIPKRLVYLLQRIYKDA